MSTTVLDALFSKTKQAILSKLLINHKKWWYHRNLAKNLSTSPSSLQRDLALFCKIGILLKKSDGNRVYYKANPDLPIFKELQSVMIKTSGLRDHVFNILIGYKKKIFAAFIYGSVARGEEVATSDIDLMIIGDVLLEDLVKKIRKVEKQIDREINPTLYSLSEFQEKVKSQNYFIVEVLKNKKIMLMGNIDEFEKVS